MSGTLEINYALGDLIGATYNPRAIDAASITRLTASLKSIGIVKPIIVRGKTIVAGHQRTMVAKSLGITHGPAYVLGSNANDYDECRFNQLHNGTDTESGEENCRIDIRKGAIGWQVVAPKAITGNMRAPGVGIRAEICKLIGAFGAWGSAVCSIDGSVFHASQYALACRQLDIPLLVYVMPAALDKEARTYLAAQYGRFNYTGLKRTPYLQTYAQLYRHGRNAKRVNLSPTYEAALIPWALKNPGARILDFGCGRGDYVKILSPSFNILGLEFFRRAAGSPAIDVGAVNLMVSAVVKSLTTHGRFDAVICDYVLNSVDSVQAESDVLTCIQALVKPGGSIFLSGRTRVRIDYQLIANTATGQNRNVEFLDDEGFTAIFQNGGWF